MVRPQMEVAEMITREQCLKWAEEVGAVVVHRDWKNKALVGNDKIEALCQRVWNEAQKAEREECAKVCEETITYPAGHGGQWEGYGPVTTTRGGKECAAAIRARGEK